MKPPAPLVFLLDVDHASLDSIGDRLLRLDPPALLPAGQAGGPTSASGSPAGGKP